MRRMASDDEKFIFVHTPTLSLLLFHGYKQRTYREENAKLILRAAHIWPEACGGGRAAFSMPCSCESRSSLYALVQRSMLSVSIQMGKVSLTVETRMGN